MEEDNFDEELEKLIKDAMDEREEIENDGRNEDDGEENSNSGESDEGDHENESEEDSYRTERDGDEDKNQTNDETDVKSTFKPIEVDVSGVKVTINSEEEMLAFVKKGASTFNKEQESFVEEKTIIEQGRISAEDLKLLVDAKNGSKEAIALLAKKANIDILDVEAEMADSYKQQTQYQIQTEVDKVADEILSDTELASEFRKVIGILPSDFVNEVTTNARDLKAFAGHIKNGMAQKVIPMAITSQIVNGGTFLENYNKVGMELAQKEQQPKQERNVGEREQNLRKRASSGTGHNDSKTTNSSKDIWEMSDEEFENLDLSKLK